MIEGTVRIRSNSIDFYPHISDTFAVKEVGGRWKNGAWRLPKLHMYLSALRELYPQSRVSEDPLLSEWGFPRRAFSISEIYRESWDLLYRFQRDAIQYLISTPNPGALIALSPGLGKTPVSLLAAKTLRFPKVLIVSPLPLLRNWERESIRWVGEQPTLCWGRDPDSDFVVTNYDTVVLRSNEYASRKWDLVIFDESILLKNRDTKRWETLFEFRNSVGTVWELSGSPISQGFSDLWAQFRILHPKAFPSFWRFAKRYCFIGDGSPWGEWTITGDRPNVDPRSDLRDMMFVRSQDEELPGLPEYIKVPFDVVMSDEQDEIYNTALEDFLILLESEVIDIPNRIAQLVRLQQIVSNPINVGGKDLSAKSDVIVDLLASGTYELPALVWVHWQAGAKALYDRLMRTKFSVGIATGQYLSRDTLDETIQAYKSGEFQVLILSLGVGKFGHTLTNTRTVIYHDRTWDADAYVQSLHRVRRIGLGHSPVLLSLHCQNSVDDLVDDALSTKSISIASISNADLKKLLVGLR